MKKTLINVSVVVVVLAIGAAYLLKPYSSKDFDIAIDEQKIRAKEAFLSEKNTDSAIKRPNIIILFADDLGKTDISLYGNNIVQTPNIEALAAEGVKFTEGYVTAPICSPSRAGMLTGRVQQRFGHEFQPVNRYLSNRLEKFIVNTFFDLQHIQFLDTEKVPDATAIAKQGLPLGEITLAELLKKSGYATGIIGKWHLGFSNEFLPLQRGFDYHYGFYEAFSWFADTTDERIVNILHRGIMDSFIWKNGNSGFSLKRRNTETIETKEYYTYALAKEANQFIEQHKEEPFLLYVPFNAPHTPFQALKNEVAKYQAKGVIDPNKAVYYAMISSLDSAVGSIHNTVKKLGLEENTLIFFLSDNGGATYTEATDNAPLKGGKMSLYEGGINVPFVIKWKSKIQPGTVYEKPVSAVDIFATSAAAVSATLPKDRIYDGVNLLTFLTKQDTSQPHKILFWRSGTNKAVRKGDWKLVLNLKDNITALYNLKTDKNERNNLAEKEVEKLNELQTELIEWEKTLVKPLWPSNGYYKNNMEGNLDRYAL